jgi:outer membrane protein OmpA-like peptidoglycan-associated protein
MAEDWAIDVRKYVPNADSKVIDAIVRYCGISLHNRDSSLVSFTEPEELNRVRENYLKKKLGLTHSNAELDSAIAGVGERMAGDRTKNRVTVYYLLAEHFGKLSVFGGTDVAGGIGKATLAAGALGAGAAAASVASAATDASATVADFGDRAHRTEDRPPPAAPVYAARSAAAAAPAASGGMARWLPWLLGLAALALLAWFFLGRQPATTPVAEVRPTAPAVVAPPVQSVPAPTVATTPVAPATTAGAPATAAPAATPPAVVVGLPAAVHFSLGSAAVGGDDSRLIDQAAAAIRREDLRVAITGYTDRTGNLTLNQRLAQQRAESVRDRLIAAGVPAANIEMVAPAAVENGPAATPDFEARRVEITRR